MGLTLVSLHPCIVDPWSSARWSANLTGKIQKPQQVFPTFKVDGVEQSPEQAVEAFNNYFLNVTENLNIHVAQDDNPI